MSQPKPLLIALPVYNPGESLDKTLASLAAFSPSLCDIHIFDNRSEENLAMRLPEWRQKLPNLTLHLYPENTGQPGNFNRAFLFASAYKYLAWLGAGDCPLPGYYERAIDWLENNPDCALAYSDDAEKDGLLSYDQQSWQERARAYLQNPGLGNINYGVMPKSIALRLNPWRYLAGNDHIMHLNLLLLGKIYKIPQRLFRRDWPCDRPFSAYYKTCTGGRPEDCPYLGFGFRSLDMLYGYIELANTYFTDSEQRNEFLQIIRLDFYKPLKAIIQERLAIVEQGLALKNEPAKGIIYRQAMQLRKFIAG